MPKEMKESLIEMSMENAMIATKIDRQDLQAQRNENTHKRRKYEEIQNEASNKGTN
jgi:hypothetical protein